MADTNHDDPYAFLLDLCRISPSQEELLRRCPFVGDTLHDKPSPSSGQFPVASTGIVMVSLPETQDDGRDSSGPQDVFHTPPEESSLPTSDDRRRNTAFDNCAVSHAVDADDGTQRFVDSCGYSEGAEEFVDLGRDSDLGFSEAQLTQGIDVELVADCSCGVEGDGVDDTSRCQFVEFGVLEREFSSNEDSEDLREFPLKRLKLSEQNSGFDPSRDSFGVESRKFKEGMGNFEGKPVPESESPCNSGADVQPQENACNEDNACKEISMDKNLGSSENVETQVIQPETIGSGGDVNVCGGDEFPCTVEGNESSDKVIIAETSEREKRSDEQPELRVLPSSIRERLEKATKELECGEGREEVIKKSSVFDVLKVLSENPDEGNIENFSLMEAAKIRGIAFPPPRWWPDNDNYRKQRIV